MADYDNGLPPAGQEAGQIESVSTASSEYGDNDTSMISAVGLSSTNDATDYEREEVRSVGLSSANVGSNLMMVL